MRARCQPNRYRMELNALYTAVKDKQERIDALRGYL